MVVVAVILVFLLKGGGGDKGPFTPDPQTPAFAFETSKVLVVATTTDAKAETLKTKAKVPGDEVKKIVNALYINAFLDPSNWEAGSYDDVWALFDTGSGTEAQTQVDTLTAGTGAGDTFDTILPTGTSTLNMKVLFDPKDAPYSVVAIVKFKATGSGKVGVTGFCMGGALTLLSVVNVPEADAGVCWYGYPPLEYIDASKIKSPLLAHFATEDVPFPIAKVDELEKKLRAANVKFEFHRYNAKHAFANETADSMNLPILKYDPEAAALAWRRTMEFLDRHLKGAGA